MELVDVARFEDPSHALIVARFLRKHGVWAKAFVPDDPGGGRYGQPVTRGRVVVEEQDESRAHALFNRVRRGEFVDVPGHDRINQLVLGGPSDEPDFDPITVTPTIAAGRILVGVIVGGSLLVVLVLWLTGNWAPVL